MNLMAMPVGHQMVTNGITILVVEDMVTTNWNIIPVPQIMPFWMEAATW